MDEFLVPVKAASVLDILEASHVRSSMRSAPTLAALRACAFFFSACPLTLPEALVAAQGLMH